jgi:heme oxygenase (biliverdin-IX-beta and delta-forming)
MNLLQRLKIETARAHERIEEAFDLEAITHSISAYRDLVGRLYGFHAVWEPLAGLALSDPEFFRKRQKLHFLRTDLHNLGMNGDGIARLAPCYPTVTMRTPAEAWGSMYVVEGSTLGGVIIARDVERRLGLNRHNGCRYFRCYGTDVRPMWTSFGAKLLAHCGPAEEETVVAAACRTFETMQYWLYGR